MESWQQRQRSLSELLQEQQEPFIVMDHGCSRSRRRMKRNRHAGGVGRSSRATTSASLWHGNAWSTGSLQHQSLSPVGGKSPSTSRLKLMEAAIKILEPSLQTPTGRSRSRSRSKSKCPCSPNVTTVRYLLELDHKANICQSQSHFRRSSAGGLVLNSGCESPQICGRWVAKQLSVWQRASGAILSTLKPAVGSCSSRKKHGSLLRYSRLFTFRRPTGPTAEDGNKEKHGLFRSIFRHLTRNNNHNHAAAAASVDESNQTELRKPDPENASAGSKAVVRICDIVRWGSFGNDAEFPGSFMDKRQRRDCCYSYSQRSEMNSQQQECSGSNSSCSRRLESDCSFTSTNSASSSSADSDSASGEVPSSSSSSARCGSASSSSCCHCQCSSRDSNGHCCFKNEKGSFSPRAPLMASSPDREITISHRLSTNDEFLSLHNETENSDATQDCCPNSDMFETANSEWLEDLEQSSPVSVLDSPFNEAACANPTLDSIQRAKMRLLERISAYEKLAQMDVPQFAEAAESSGEEVDLERPRTSSSSSSASSVYYPDIHVDYDTPQNVENQEQIRVQFHSKFQIPSSSSSSSSSTSVMMEETEEEEEYTQKWLCVAELVEMDMRGDTGEWTEFRQETQEIGVHLELGIFRLLLQELLQDLLSFTPNTTTINPIQSNLIQ